MKDKNITEKNSSSTFIRTMTLAFPIILQNLLVNGVSFADTLMIGQLGENSIAAVGLANQVFFLITIILYGTSNGASIFISQYFGAKNQKGIARTMGYAFVIALAFGFIFSLGSFLFPGQIIHIFTKNAAVTDIGSSYLKIVAVSYIFTSISMVFAAGYRATNNALTPLRIASLALIIDIVGNYLLIFGIGPFPQLGVRGAAISTTACRFVETALLIIISRRKKGSPMHLRVRRLFQFSKKFTAQFFKVASPVILNDLLWAIGMTCYKIAYARIGVDVIAASQVSESIYNLFFVLSFGYSSAAGIIVGNTIGEKDIKKAMTLAREFLKYAIYIGIGTGLALALSAPFIAPLFNMSQEVGSIVVYSLLMIGIVSPIKSFDNTLVIGVLRGGGDATFCFFVETLSVWLVGVPLAFLGALVFHLSLPQLYLLLTMDSVVKIIISTPRLKSGKWIKLLAGQEE